MIEINHENLIFHYLYTNLVPKEVLFHLNNLPEEPVLSESFYTEFTKFVQKFIINEISSNFGYRQFYFPESGITINKTVFDKDFWIDLKFNFTDNLIKRIWEDLLSKGDNTTIKPQWKDVNQFEALFLSNFNKQYRFDYNFEWLLKNNADWHVISYFILKITKDFVSENSYWNYATTFPFNYFYQNYQSIPFSLRFLLLEETSDYLCHSVNSMNIIIEELSNRILDPTHFFQNFEFKKFVTDEILKALNYWCEEGSVTFDDYEYLKSISEAGNLHQNINELKRISRSLEEIRRELKL